MKAQTAILLLLVAAGSGDQAQFAAPKDATTEDAIPVSRFPRVDGKSIKGEYIDLAAPIAGRLFFRYSPYRDSGVEIERVLPNGRIAWRKNVEFLGVFHSGYVHRVEVRIKDGEVLVSSLGARQILERRDLLDGRQISRQIKEIER